MSSLVIALLTWHKPPAIAETAKPLLGTGAPDIVAVAVPRPAPSR